MPIPIASPPIDITVSPTPAVPIRRSAISTEKGMVSEAMSALRTSHRKRSMTSTMRSAPSRIDTWRWSSDFRISIDWS